MNYLLQLKSNINAALFCLTFISLASCQGTEHNNNAIKSFAINVERITDIDTLERAFEIERIIPLETKQKSLLSSYQLKVVVIDSMIAVQDQEPSNPIKLFNLAGYYIGDVGKKGQGPGEYITNNYLTIGETGDTFEVYDRTSMKILKYGRTGQMLSERKAKNMYLSGFEHLDKNSTLYYFCSDANSTIHKRKTNYRFINVDSNFDIIQRLLPEPIENVNSVASVNHHFCVKTPLGFCISDNFSDTIYNYLNEKVYPSYVVNFGKHSLPNKFLTMPTPPVDGFPDKQRYAEKNNLAFLCDVSYESDHFLFVNYFWKNSLHFALYDKNNGNVRTSNVLFSKEKGMIFPAPLHFDGKSLISILSANDFKSLIDFWSKRNKISADIQKINQKLSHEDNPILIFMKLK